MRKCCFPLISECTYFEVSEKERKITKAFCACLRSCPYPLPYTYYNSLLCDVGRRERKKKDTHTHTQRYSENTVIFFPSLSPFFVFKKGI